MTCLSCVNRTISPPNLQSTSPSFFHKNRRWITTASIIGVVVLVFFSTTCYAHNAPEKSSNFTYDYPLKPVTINLLENFTVNADASVDVGWKFGNPGEAFASNEESTYTAIDGFIYKMSDFTMQKPLSSHVRFDSKLSMNYATLPSLHSVQMPCLNQNDEIRKTFLYCFLSEFEYDEKIKKIIGIAQELTMKCYYLAMCVYTRATYCYGHLGASFSFECLGDLSQDNPHFYNGNPYYTVKMQCEGRSPVFCKDYL